MAVDLFPPEASDDLDGPTWLRARRAAATAALAEWDLPTTEMEEWRYSRIGDLRPERFTLADVPAAADVPVPAAAFVAELGPLAGVVVVHNGSIVSVEQSADVRDAGVVFGPAAESDESLLGAGAEHAHGTFVVMNGAFSAVPIVLSVPRSTTVDLPFAIINYVDIDAGAVFPRLTVTADENSELSVLEVSLSADVEALVVPVTELRVGAAARVRHSSLQDVGPRVWQIGSLVATISQDATLRSGNAMLGGDYADFVLTADSPGGGAHGDLSSVYFGDGDQMLDLRTFQEHQAPDTTSNLLFKGAVADRSHSVYTGLIRIRPEARGANAFQTNRNLKLSEDAWAESVPNLEIENNDVHCSHASTVGPVDEDQRFYLESRGVPTAAAERLIVGGFYDEVLDDLPVQQLAEPVRSRIDVLLDQLMGAGLSTDGTSPGPDMSNATRLCALADLVDGAAARFDLDGRRLAVVRLGDSVYVIGDECSHADVSLSGGEVEARDCTIECPKHGSEFDLRTGEPKSLPAVRPVPRYETTVVDGDVMVELT